MEIQLPLTPESLSGDCGLTTWTHTPEGGTVYVQSCFGTVPAETQENTSAVPLYTPTVWCEEQKQMAGQSWMPHTGEYLSPTGQSYMIPRDWTQHVPAQRGNRFLSDYGSVILPETSPLSIHQWQDVGIDHWQDDGCSWPLVEAGWEFSSGSEQRAWDWNPGTEESYTIWTDCPMPEDPACWMNDSHITEHVPVLKQQADSQIPEYMPAIQRLPQGVVAAEESESVPLVPALKT
jgi:hypothetical protein